MRLAFSPLPVFRLLPCIALLLITLVVPPAVRAQPADEEDAPQFGVEAGRPRNFPGGIRGLSPAEAKAAQELLEKGRALEADGKDSAALGMYKRVWKRYPRSTSAPQALERSAEIYKKRDNLQRAFEAIDMIVRGHPNYGKFNELISEEYRIAYEMIRGKRQKMFGIFPGFPNRDRGIEFFERLILNAPYSDYAPLALMNVANEYARTDRTDFAIDALDRLITNYPNTLVTPDAYLKLAQVHAKLVTGPLYDQESTRQSITHYEDFLILFPRDPNVGQAEEGLAQMRDMLAESRLKIADFYYLKRARYTAARVFYNEAITIAPNSATAQRARERIAQVDADEAKWQARRAAEAERPPRKPFLGIFGRERQSPGTVQPQQPAGPADAEPPPSNRVTEQPTTGAPSGR